MTLCAICLEEMNVDIHITICNHQFHETCIENILTPICPLCRQDLVPSILTVFEKIVLCCMLIFYILFLVRQFVNF